MHSLDIEIDKDGRLGPRVRPAVSKLGIYLIFHKTFLIRVGESSSGFERIFKGFRQQLRHVRRGQERKNYLAYPWREHYKKLKLTIDYHPLTLRRFEDAHFRRALEAELTFQFRLAHGKWPLRMSEIHFLERHRTSKVLVQAASKILEFYGHDYNAAV